MQLHHWAFRTELTGSGYPGSAFFQQPVSRTPFRTLGLGYLSQNNLGGNAQQLQDEPSTLPSRMSGACRAAVTERTGPSLLQLCLYHNLLTNFTWQQPERQVLHFPEHFVPAWQRQGIFSAAADFQGLSTSTEAEGSFLPCLALPRAQGLIFCSGISTREFPSSILSKIQLTQMAVLMTNTTFSQLKGPTKSLFVRRATRYCSDLLLQPQGNPAAGGTVLLCAGLHQGDPSACSPRPATSSPTLLHGTEQSEPQPPSLPSGQPQAWSQ